MNTFRTKILILFVALLSSCKSNTFERNFIAHKDATIQSSNFSDNSQNINLVETGDIDVHLQILLLKNYQILGFNDFNGPMKSKHSALEFASKVGATDVLFSREYLGKEYVNPAAAVRQEPYRGSINAKLPAGGSNFKKFENFNNYHYSVVYLKTNNKFNLMSDDEFAKVWTRLTDVERNLANAKKGNVFAQFMIGEALFFGDGIDLNIAEGVKWLTKASEKGHNPSTCSLGNKYRGPHPALIDKSNGAHRAMVDFKKALNLLKKGAELGDGSCQRYLGDMYKNGEGIPVDRVKAHMWLSVVTDRQLDNLSYYAGVEKEKLEGQMSAAEIKKASLLASTWKDKYPDN